MKPGDDTASEGFVGVMRVYDVNVPVPAETVQCQKRTKIVHPSERKWKMRYFQVVHSGYKLFGRVLFIGQVRLVPAQFEFTQAVENVCFHTSEASCI